MLTEWFAIGFGVGLGLLSSVLVVILGAGVLDALLTKWQWRRTFGGRR